MEKFHNSVGQIAGFRQTLGISDFGLALMTATRALNKMYKAKCPKHYKQHQPDVDCASVASAAPTCSAIMILPLCRSEATNEIICMTL